jgi:hypothetical protein
MVSVYQLRKDNRHIEDVQKATLTTYWFGVAKTHGLFGSDEWWGNIETGKLAVHTLRGVITRVYMDGPHGDLQLFDMRSDSGREYTWARHANNEQVPGLYTNKKMSDLYDVGRKVEVDYVFQRHRLFGYGSFFRRHKVVIEVRIANDA